MGGMLDKLHKLLCNPGQNYNKIIPYLKFKKYITLRKILVRSRFQNFFKKIYDLSLEGMSVAAWGEEEFCERYLKLRCGLTGGIVLDVGANIGEYTENVIRLVGNLKVFCFEPGPKIFLKLKDRLGGNSNCFLYNLACGKGNEFVELHDFDAGLNYDGAHASLFKETLDEVNKNKYKLLKNVVKCVKLDDFIAENHIKQVDLLKIDVEGAELDVLKGVEDSLRRGIIHAVQFEFNFCNTESGHHFKDFFVFFKDFNLFRILPTGYLLPLNNYNPRYCEIFVMQNIVAIKKGLDVSKIADK